MLNLEEQIHNLADAAFDTTEPVTVPVQSVRHRGRIGSLVGAAAVVVGLLGSVIALSRGSESDVIVAVDNSAQVVEITDPMSIDLTDVASESSQARIQRLSAVTVLDTKSLAETLDVERMVLATAPTRFALYEYWQQVTVRTPERVRLVVNVYGTEASWPPLEDNLGDEITVRNRSGRQSSGVTWLENEQLRIEIVGGPGNEIAKDIDDEMLALAETLTFVESEGDWTDDSEDYLGPSVDGEPILAGVVAAIEWDVIEKNHGELAVRTGDLNRVALTLQENQNNRTDGVTYSVQSLAIPGGALIIGSAPSGVDQIELLLEGGDRVILPTVDTNSGRSAFAIPIDDRLDPLQIQTVNNGGAVGRAIDLSNLPPYLGGPLGGGS